MTKDATTELQEQRMQIIALQEENEALTSSCGDLEEKVDRITADYQRLKEESKRPKMPLIYKIAIALGIVGAVAFIGAITLLTSSPKETYQAVWCDVTCATYTARRTATVWMFWPVLWVGVLSLIAGAGLAIGRALHDSPI